MMVMMVAELGMSTFPVSCTEAVRGCQMTAKWTRQKVKRPVVMSSDSGTLLFRQRESQAIEDINGPAAVTTAVVPSRLAQVVEQAHDSNAIGSVTVCVREHVLIHLKGMLGKATVLLVVTIAATLEVARGQEVVDNGFDAGAPGSAEDLTDPVFGIGHIRHSLCDIYSPNPDFLHAFSQKKMSTGTI